VIVILLILLLLGRL